MFSVYLWNRVANIIGLGIGLLSDKNGKMISQNLKYEIMFMLLSTPPIILNECTELFHFLH